MSWKPADDPPNGEIGKWTRDVVVLTNYGDVFVLSYFHDMGGGEWGRASRFNRGEKVAWWIDKPEVT